FLTTGEHTLIARDGTGRQYFDLGNDLKVLMATPSSGSTALAIITTQNGETLHDLRLPKATGTVALQGDVFTKTEANKTFLRIENPATSAKKLTNPSRIAGHIFYGEGEDIVISPNDIGALPASSVLQSTGASKTAVISQDAATREFAKKSSADFLTTGEHTLIARDGTGRQYFDLGNDRKVLMATPSAGTTALAIITTQNGETLYDLRLPKATGTVALQGDIIGVNQKWEDVSTSRAINTTYINSLNKPIQVSISVRAGTTQGAQFAFIVDSVKIAEDAGDSHIWDHTLSAIIPPQKSYKIEASSNVSIKKWAELK
ncbi:hypothetical protein AB7W14_10650, partial [Providencia rettgeri]